MNLPTEPLAPPAKVWRSLTRYRVPAAALFVGVLAVVVAATVLTPRAYRSQAKLFLRLGRENATLDPTATLGQNPVVAVPPSRENEINSVLEILKSRTILEKVADRIGPGVILGTEPWDPARLAAPPPAAPPPSRVVDDRYRAVVQLNRRIDAEAVRKSNVIQINYEGPSPDVAQAVVTCLVEFYLDEHTRVNRTPGARQFLAEQTQRLRRELAAAEDDLRKLKDETGLLAPDVQRQILVDRVGRVESELAGVAATAAAGEAEAKALRERLAALPANSVTGTTRGLPNQALDQMRAQLYTLQLKEIEARARFPENSPEVAQAHKQTTAAAELLAKEEAGREQVTTGPNRAREEAELALLRQEVALASARARATALEAQLTRERGSLRAFTADQVRVAKLQREVDLLDGQYRRFADNLERAEVDHALEAEKISNVGIVQPATFDAKPVRPNTLMNAALGLAFAVAGAVGLAVLLDSRSYRPAPAAAAPDRLVQLASLAPADGPGRGLNGHPENGF